MKQMTMTQASIKDFVHEQLLKLDVEQESEAFEYVAAQEVLKQYNLDDNEIDRGHVGSANDGGYDGIYIFVNDVLMNGEEPKNIQLTNCAKIDIHLIQAKYQAKFQEVNIQNWKDSFRNLIKTGNPDQERYNNQIIECFRLIRSLLTKIVTKQLQVTFTFWGVSLVEQIHDNVNKQASELKEVVKDLLPSNVNVQVRILTDKQFFEYLQQNVNKTYALATAKNVLFPDAASAVLTVNLFSYYQFITDECGNLNKLLFEDNIRDYQGNVKVNGDIQDTLKQNYGVDFWWLNNGITILADEMTRGLDDIVGLVNPRIVNGLQTSNEIWRYYHNNGDVLDGTTDNRKVLVKCIKANDQDIRARIIRAANSQTSIPPAYLHSLDQIQLQIEQYFTRQGLHYDRRKNSCKNDGVSPQEIVTVPFLGQCLISTLLGQPDYARARPAQILNDTNKYESIFNEKYPLEAYSSLARLGLSANKFLKKASGLERGVQNDLIFYLIYVVCARQVNSFNITADSLRELSIPEESEFKQVTDKLYKLYKQEGGTSQVVKNAQFTECVKKEFM